MRKDPQTMFEIQERLLFATNRANVLPIFSSGFIRPRAAYEKYYDDLLKYWQGHLMLWHNGFPSPLLPLLSEGNGMFPILLDIDKNLLPKTKTRIQLRKDFTTTESKGFKLSRNTICELFQTPIPISAIKALCFKTEDNLEDFRARSFENTLPLPSLSVDPLLFNTAGPDPEKFAALGSAAPITNGTTEDFRKLDSAMGAINMLALLLPKSRSWLDALANALKYPNSQKRQIPDPHPWLLILIKLILEPAQPKYESSSVDCKLMNAAIQVLKAAKPSEGWVEEKLTSDIALLANGDAKPSDVKEIIKWRDIVVATSKGEKQIEYLDDSKSVVRRGLMLLILRGTPERIIHAKETHISPGDQVTAIAGMLSGLFCGYTRLSMKLKTKGCNPNSLAELALSWWAELSGGHKQKKQVEVVTKEESVTKTSTSITVNQTTLLEQVFIPNEQMLKFYDKATDAGQTLKYEPELNAFSYDTPASDKKRERKLFVEIMQPDKIGKLFVCIRTSCLNKLGEPIKLLKSQEAMKLTQLNYETIDPVFFAVDPKSKTITAIVRQQTESVTLGMFKFYTDMLAKASENLEHQWNERT